ncbi:MAG: enoyl-CoA hydratase/isomerase family protein, partial [Blastomonas sp.]|nr:enoyl-CoA hydratase/isomerase family protein [Blastomonas sp.]
MTQPIMITSNGAVDTVTLNRPGALNAMDEPMIMALQDYFRGLPDRHTVRVVI